MSEHPEEGLVLSWQPAGRNGTVTITATLNGQTIAADKFDILKASKRTDFLVTLTRGREGIDRTALETQLLEIATEMALGQHGAEIQELEAETVDFSRVVRPELFHLPEVSGILVPNTVWNTTHGEEALRGRWELLLRWADGRRERVLFKDTLEMPDGRSVFFVPTPAPPTLAQKPGWSKSAQTAWLGGMPCPSPKRVCRLLGKEFWRFLHFQEDTVQGNCALLTIWTILSYGLPAWDACPYLWLTGPKGSGKSRVLEVAEQVVFRPLSTSNASAATLFRRLHAEGGVILFDEAESLRRKNDPGAQDLANVLLSGYRKGGSADRLEKVGDTYQPISFRTFGLKALACINEIPDALESRCIPIRMFRCPASSPKPRLRVNPQHRHWQFLRDGLHFLALEYGPKWIELADDSSVCPDWIGGREYEKWQPILAIARWLEEEGVDGLYSIVLRHAEKILEQGKAYAVPDSDAVLLRELARMTQGSEYPTAKQILEAARVAEPECFSSWTARGAARHLRQYGLEPTKSNGRWLFRTTQQKLAEIQAVYNVELW